MFLYKEIYHRSELPEEERSEEFKDGAFKEGNAKLNHYKSHFYWLDNQYEQYWDEFDRILNELESKSPKFKYFFADIAASVIQTLYKSGHFEITQWKAALACIVDIILDLGCLELTERTMRNRVKQSYDSVKNVMLVAGCQNQVMLERRIRLAVYIYSMCENNIKVVFSGGNPNYEKPSTIRNESARMENLFVNFAKEKNADFNMQDYNTSHESKSKRTVENIAKFFEGNYLDDRSPNNIIIVSSSFHLIRLCQDVEEYINQNNPKQKINQIILAGSEDPGDKWYLTFDHIIKHMFMEINYYFQKKYYQKREKPT